MAPTRPPSTTSRSARSSNRSPSSSSAASSGVSKAGRPKNQWTAERRRKAVRLYFFTTISQVEIVDVLGHGYWYVHFPNALRRLTGKSKSDNERRIRELFLAGEVPSRSKWCKHNAAGHQNSIAQWEIFEQYKVQPWRRSRYPIRHNQSATPRTAEASEDEAPVVSTRPQDHLVLRKEADEDVINRVNQLGNKYLPAHLRSVASVYRHSMSTVRSSWASLTSTFRSSEASSIYRRSSIRESGREGLGVKPLAPLLRFVSAKLPSALTQEEQLVWDILIDDDQFGHDDDDAEDIKDDPTAARRGFLRTAAENRNLKLPPTSIGCFMELKLRPCGDQHLRGNAISNLGMEGDDRCKTCGCSKFQEIARLGIGGQRYARLDLDQRDFYDNTLLFYYITSTCFTVDGLKTLVANGANIRVQNSFGASFMHCFGRDWLQRCEIPELHSCSGTFGREFVDLLEFLAGQDFPFFHRNEHGQTVAHLLFKHVYLSQKWPCILHLDRILTALNTDIDALDNQGYCVGQYLDLIGPSFCTDQSREHYEALKIKMSRASSLNSGNLMLDFKKVCSSAQRNGQAWSIVVKELGYSYQIDAKGDSPLIAMLKVWDESRDIEDRYKCTKKLLELGTGIDLKDRRGNTALVIAARRGFRTTVEQLVESGANPNTVNYSGRSILFMTKGWLKMAKRMKDDRRYARIASCIPVLQQSQAVFEPSVHRQRLSAKTRAKLAAGQLQSSHHA